MRDMMRDYRREGLAVDAAELEKVAATLSGLITSLPLTARLMQSDATGDALVKLAQSLADTLHDGWADVIAAHDAATDEEGIEPIYRLDVETAVAFGMRQPDGARPVMQAAE